MIANATKKTSIKFFPLSEDSQTEQKLPEIRLFKVRG